MSELLFIIFIKNVKNIEINSFFYIFALANLLPIVANIPLVTLKFCCKQMTAIVDFFLKS